MRRRKLTAIALVLAVPALMVACETEVSDEPDSEPDPAAQAEQSDRAQEAEQTEQEAEPESADEKATVGDSITIEDLDDNPLQVTLLAVENPTPSTNEFIEPDAGNQFAAAQLRITNRGDAPFEDSISNGAAVVTQDDVEYDASFFEVKTPELGSVTITPGDTRTGWVSFEIAQGSNIRTVQWSADSGFGDTAQWTVK